MLQGNAFDCATYCRSFFSRGGKARKARLEATPNSKTEAGMCFVFNRKTLSGPLPIADSRGRNQGGRQESGDWTQK